MRNLGMKMNNHIKLPLKFTIEESRGVRRYITTTLTKEEYDAYKNTGGKYEGLRAIQALSFPGEDPELIYNDLYLNCVYSDEYSVGFIGEGDEVMSYIIFPESKYYIISSLPIDTEVILDHIAEMLAVDVPDPVTIVD